MKYIKDSFPYKPEQIIFWIENNVISRGLLIKAEITVQAKYENKECFLTDNCTLHVLPDYELKNKEPAIILINPEDAFFSLESALGKIVIHEEKTYNVARDRCGAW